MGGANPLFAVAAVCEKLGSFDRALAYIDAALSTDLTRAGTSLPGPRILFNILRGRVLAALDRVPEAADAFETAALSAHEYGIRMYEIFSLVDLKLCVLDHIGHGDHGLRRVGDVLRLLEAPPERLTPLLKGLNVAELMASPPPDPNYMVVYDLPETSGSATLRAELSALKPKALKTRAREGGVSEELLEDADDADDVKSALIQLILDATASKTDRERAGRQALESELAELKPKALKKRARSSGVGEDLLEDADDADDVKAAIIALIVSAESAETPKPAPAAEDRPHFGRATDTLRAELSALRLKELRKRARDSGVDSTLLEDAADSDDPKSAVIELLIADQLSSAGPSEADLRAELELLRLKELRGRAKAAGISTDALEDAADSDDPKSAVIELLTADQLATEQHTSGAMVALRAELEAMRFKELRERAQESGVDSVGLEKIIDDDEPKAALIDVLLQRAAARSTSVQAQQQTLLQGLPLKELRTKAKAAAVSEEALDDALDAEDVKATVIDLILDASRPPLPEGTPPAPRHQAMGPGRGDDEHVESA
eukprot:COSAG06_NODE_1787_length_8398_cov_5.335944_5_plen_549_part_00